MNRELDLDELEEKMHELLEEPEKKKRVKDSEYRKVRQLVFDERTVRILVKLFNKGVIEDFTWIVSTGKEAVVLAGKGPEGEIAIKIYKIATANFKKYLDYISFDHRFIPTGDKARIIRIWAQREFRNLARMHQVGVRVPKPIEVQGNVLVMEFIGEGGEPAPLLRDVYDMEDPEYFLSEILSYVKRIYLEAELVHGDLSEYNVMYWKGEPWIIDVSQAVPLNHPLALGMLRRDVENVTSFFKKRFGVEVPDPYEFVDELISSSGT
jgi:RIO kinase 1